MTTPLKEPCRSRREEAHELPAQAGSPRPLRLAEGSGVTAAAADFRAQVAAWVARLGVKPRPIRIQPMRPKWASCSTRGTVSFSTSLFTQPADFREYVIVHELLHLKIPNHGKLFKSLLRAHLPNYETIHPQPPPLDGPASRRTV